MKTVLAVLLCSSLAFGQVADAPLLPPEGRVMELHAGEIVPFPATCLDKAQALRTAKRVAGAEAEAADLKKGNTILPTPAFIAIVGAGGAAIITAIALGVAMAVKKP